MITLCKRYLICLSLIFAPIIMSAGEQPVKAAHRPPVLTTSAIIEIYNEGIFEGIVLIERGKIPFGKAMPGGKVEYGETIETAIRREMMEEVNLELEGLRQFHVYSDPTRDSRFHAVEITYLAVANKLPVAGDDAARVFVVKCDEIPWDELAFDHAQILRDYLDYKNGNKQLSVVIP